MTWNPEQALKIAADDITGLRRTDVFRVLDWAEPERREELAAWILKGRPDLTDEVKSCLLDIDYPATLHDTLGNDLGRCQIVDTDTGEADGQKFTFYRVKLSSPGELAVACEAFGVKHDENGTILVNDNEVRKES